MLPEFITGSARRASHFISAYRHDRLSGQHSTVHGTGVMTGVAGKQIQPRSASSAAEKACYQPRLPDRTRQHSGDVLKDIPLNPVRKRKGLTFREREVTEESEIQIKKHRLHVVRVSPVPAHCRLRCISFPSVLFSLKLSM